ncbi:MAG TPA: ATP-binding protein, partial [Polyangiales bacterium]|nr:ATP-binding protein [Polyangiales bacterium]
EHTDPDPSLRESLLRTLHELSGSKTKATALMRGPRPEPKQAGHWHLSLRFRPNVLKNGLDPLDFIAHLRTLGTLIYVQARTDALAPIAQFDPELCYLGFEVGLKTAADRAAIEAAFGLARDDCELRLLAPQSNAAEYIQVIHGLSSSQRKVGELLVASGALTQSALDAALEVQASAPEGQQPKLGEVLLSEKLVAAPVIAAALNKQKQGDERRTQEQRLIKVDASKLDQLINLIGELVIATEGARVTAGRTRQPELLEAMGRVGQIVEYVRDRALDMRMVAIGEVFQRFPRVVRDVAKELGKEIELIVSGAETELDKSMVDKLADPLLHIVRNAIDHGIEPMNERVANGKRAKGRLRLHAYHESGCVVIEITDDGRGLHRDKILAKAIERGLVTEEAELTDAEVNALLFMPGFSTAQAVTSLSGRGVGMDV